MNPEIILLIKLVQVSSAEKKADRRQRHAHRLTDAFLKSPFVFCVPYHANPTYPRQLEPPSIAPFHLLPSAINQLILSLTLPP